VTLPIALALTWANPPHTGAAAWCAFAYVTLISQVVGFFAWYNGLALGGIARVGQVQLLQAFFTIGFAALLFGEHVSALTWLFALGVVATIALGRGLGAGNDRTNLQVLHVRRFHRASLRRQSAAVTYRLPFRRSGIATEQSSNSRWRGDRAHGARA